MSWLGYFGVGRKPAPRKGTCDLCGAQIGRGGYLVSPDDMRAAATAGLRPSSTPLMGTNLNMSVMSQLMGVDPKLTDDGWLSQVYSDTTDWGLCRTCTTTVDDFIAGRRPPPDTGGSDAPTPQTPAAPSEPAPPRTQAEILREWQEKNPPFIVDTERLKTPNKADAGDGQ